MGAGTYDVSIFESANVAQYGGSYYQTKVLTIVNKDTRDLKFLLPSSLVQSDNEGIISLAKSLTAGTKSDLEALKKIHIYVQLLNHRCFSRNMIFQRVFLLNSIYKYNRRGDHRFLVFVKPIAVFHWHHKLKLHNN